MNVLTLLDVDPWIYTAYYIKREVLVVPKDCAGKNIDLVLRLVGSFLTELSHQMEHFYKTWALGKLSWRLALFSTFS
jgi:hypothetical protein